VGETQKRPFQLSFNGSLRVEFQGARVTSDGGLILVRELDERLGFGELIGRHLTDGRGKNTQLPLTDLVWQSVYSRLAGYEDVNDAERLSQDPAFRLIGSEKVLERGAALTSRLQSFETELLTQAENLAGLAVLNRELVAKGETIGSPRRVVLDMDSTEVRFTPDRSKARSTSTSSPPAITPCCCSTAHATAWRRNCARATSTAPRAGRNCCCRDRAPTAAGQAGRVSCRRGLRQAGDLRGAGRTQGEVRHPPSGQRQSGAQGCAVVDPASGKAEL
jgi:DDE family transposase